MGRIWPTGLGLPTSALGEVSGPWLAVEATGSVEATELGPGYVPPRGLCSWQMNQYTNETMSWYPSVSPLFFHLFLGYQLHTHCMPATALACRGRVDRAPALPWGPLLPLPAMWARLLGLWPQGYVREHMDEKVEDNSKKWGPPSHARLLYPSLWPWTTY